MFVRDVVTVDIVNIVIIHGCYIYHLDTLRSGDKVASIVVIQFPPRLSRSTDVIMELRYGT